MGQSILRSGFIGAYGATRKIRNHLFAGILAIIAGTLTVTTATAKDVTILVFGDSLVAGFGLPQADGFVPQLQDWIENNGRDAHLINAGVSGDTTAGGLARLDWSITPEVDAVIVELGANDILRALPAEQARDNLDAITANIAGRGLPMLITGAPVPANYGKVYQEIFQNMYRDAAMRHDALFYENFLGALISEGFAGAVALTQSDRLHPNKDGVARIVADIGPLVLKLIDRASQ